MLDLNPTFREAALSGEHMILSRTGSKTHACKTPTKFLCFQCLERGQITGYADHGESVISLKITDMLKSKQRRRTGKAPLIIIFCQN